MALQSTCGTSSTRLHSAVRAAPLGTGRKAVRLFRTPAAQRVTAVSGRRDVEAEAYEGVRLGRRGLMMGAATFAATLGTGAFPFALPSLAAELQPNIYGDGKAQAMVFDTTTRAVRHLLDNWGGFDILEGSLLRAAFHDAGTTNPSSRRQTGANGSLQYEADEPENNGLQQGIPVLVDLHANLVNDMNCPVTMADLIQIAGAEAVAKTGGPRIRVGLGRKDAPPGKKDETSNLPGLGDNLGKLTDLFVGDYELTTQDLVALSGGHTIGKLRRSGANRDLDESAGKFNNDYFKELVDDSGGSKFPSDKALMDSAESKALVRTYARNQGAFFRDFTSAYLKMGLLGINKSNTVEPDVDLSDGFCRFDPKNIRRR